MKENEKIITTTRLRGISIIEDVFDETPDPNEYGLEDIKGEEAVYVMNLTTGKKIAKIRYKKEVKGMWEIESHYTDEMLGKLEQIIETLKK